MTTNHFDEAAVSWDNEPRRVLLMKAIGKTIVQEAKLHAKMKVLDYGCGTGLVGLFLLPHVHSVIGADNSPGMLTVLQKKIAEGNLRSMKTTQLNLEGDPVPRDRFHMIVVSLVMHHIKAVDKVLRAFHQLLLPDGTLCIADLDTEPGSFHPPEVAHTVHHYGFDRATLKSQLTKIGFSKTKDTTVTTFEKPVQDDRQEKFSIFLIHAKR